MAQPDPDLLTVLGNEAATALQRWAGLTERKVRIPVARWQRSGYLDTVLTTLYVTDRSTGARLVVAKRLPAGQTTEPAVHRRAIDEAPASFRSHLVEQAFDPIILPRGGALMFQELAGRSHAWRPLADVTSDHLAEACRELTRALIWEWNSDYTVDPVAVGDFLRDEVGAAGHPYDRSTWISTAEDGPLLNPALLFMESALRPEPHIDVIVGRIHADLHDLNILMKQHRDHVEVSSFVLVDLMTYRSRGALGRDLVRLLLSVIARRLGNLSASQRRLLLPVFVRPRDPIPSELPPVVVDTLHAVYDTAADLFSRVGDDVWRRQYLLTLVAHGLVFASYENLGPARRWWFYRLAGYATGELLDELGHELRPPEEIEPVSNPFDGSGPIHRPTSTNGTPVPVEPAPAEATPATRRTYTQQQKRRVCQGLRTDWVDVATFFGIDARVRADFVQGRKPHELWEWLESRNRLHELAPALRGLGRADLASILDSRDL